MARSRWIVVGVDFSDAAGHALEHSLKLAAEAGASVACVHAYEDVPGMPALHDATPVLSAMLAEEVARSGAARLGVRVELFVRRGPPWDKLLNVATDLGADLIVVGAFGQHGAPHDSFLGSVPTRLAALSPRSLLVVPVGGSCHRMMIERGT